MDDVNGHGKNYPKMEAKRLKLQMWTPDWIFAAGSAWSHFCDMFGGGGKLQLSKDIPVNMKVHHIHTQDKGIVIINLEFRTHNVSDMFLKKGLKAMSISISNAKKNILATWMYQARRATEYFNEVSEP